MRWIKALIDKRQNDDPTEGVLLRTNFHGADLIAMDPRFSLKRPWIRFEGNELILEYVKWSIGVRKSKNVEEELAKLERFWHETPQVIDSIVFPPLKIRMQNPIIYHKPLPSDIEWPPKPALRGTIGIIPYQGVLGTGSINVRYLGNVAAK